MKKILLLACALMVVSSCTQNEMEGGALSHEQEMRFSTAQIATRVAGNEWEADDDIGIFVMSNDQVINGNINYYTTAAGASVSFSPNLDGGGVQIYYPEVETFDVFAYHPYDQDIESGYMLNFSAQDDANVKYSDFELLEASKKGLVRDGKPIDLEFTRVFSNIAVNLIAGIGFEQSEIDKFWRLTLEDQLTEATISYKPGEDKLSVVFDEDKKSDIAMWFYQDNPLFRDLVVASDATFKPAFKLELFESGVVVETLRVVATKEITTTRGGQHIFNITVNRTPLGLMGEIAPWLENDLDTESSDGTYTLSDFEHGTLIPTHDQWVITDEHDFTLVDLRNLANAVKQAVDDNEERRISLIFPNLRNFPRTAFYLTSSGMPVYSISAPSATLVDESAFDNCTKLEKVDLPKVTQIYKDAFRACSSLKEINFGYNKMTGEHAIITDIASDWSSKYNFPETDLFIGNVQDSKVSFGDDNKTMTVDGITYTFKSITRE